MVFKDNLRYLRYVNNMSQDELAAKLNYNSFTTVQKWEDGSALPRVKTLNKIAEIFNVEVDHLLNIDLRTKKVLIPILGEVKAGYDMYIDENICGYEYCDSADLGPGEYFYLKVQGDSMKDLRIAQGDIVFVRKQDFLEEKDIGVFLIDDNEVTIKMVSFVKDGIILKAANDKYPDRKFNNNQIKILGKVIHNKIIF